MAEVLARRGKFEHLANIRCRGGEVKLNHFQPTGLCRVIPEVLASKGITGSVLHGGALRDHFALIVRGWPVAVVDYDNLANLLAVEDSTGIQIYREEDLVTLFDRIKGDNLILEPNVPANKRALEFLPGNDSDGHPQRVVTMRLAYIGHGGDPLPVDVVLTSNFKYSARQIATRGGDSISSIAMDPNGDVFADSKFEGDFESGTFRLYDDEPTRVIYARNYRHPRLSDRYRPHLGRDLEFIHDVQFS